MTLIEALKQLKVIQKRIQSNANNIQAYASKPSTEKPFFDSENEQKQQVTSLLQSNKDLLNEYMKLKQSLEKSNLEIKVEILGKQYSISELLMLRRFGCQWMMTTIQALNDSSANNRLRNAPQDAEGRNAFIERLYDEKDKNKELRSWEDLLNAIDSRLEIVNATTDLVE